MLHDAVADARGGELPGAAPHAAVSGGRLAGLRLLVAEDNVNNQQVVRELLVAEGAIVEVAPDGAAAVAAVAHARPRYDAVLMDLQMPGMDGYTATSRIRQGLGLHALPIVAMTANAMVSDRAACLAAGMNEHVGKPFDLDHLVEVLQRLTGRQGAAAAPMPPEPLVDDAGGVELEAALRRLGGRGDVYHRLLADLVADLGRWPAVWQALADDGRVDELRRATHTLRGLAATLGARDLAAQAATAERALAGVPGPSAVAATLQRLFAAMAQSLPTLRALASRMAGEAAAAVAPPGGAAPEPLEPLLQALAQRLTEADMDALAVLDRLRAAHAGRLGERLAPLDDAVSRLDFERALPLCRSLIEACRA
jgi:CheY-like chemotaxis protein/HPt (histidine-containing phosphotransfer) domain-containing protein